MLQMDRRKQKRKGKQRNTTNLSPLLGVHIFSSSLLFSLAIFAYLNVKFKSEGLNMKNFEISLQGVLMVSEHDFPKS